MSYGQSPVANFTVSDDTGCAPFIVQFTNTTTGSATGYQWNFGDGSGISTLTNPAHTYSSPSTYTVTLTATGNPNSIKTFQITVLGSPIVNFTANVTSGCPPLTITFTDNSNPVVPGPATYSWGFGNGATANTQHATYTFVTPGIYPITHTVTNSGGCVTSLVKTQYINVFTPPDADFTFTTVCKAPGTTTFTSTIVGSGPFIHSWDFGDGSPNSGLSSPTHTYLLPSTYNVRLIVTGPNGCKDTVIKPLGIGTLNASFNAPASACKGSPVHFVNTSTSAGSHIWDFGDGSPTISSTSPFHIFVNAGIYTVKLYSTDVPNTCTDTFTKTITILPGPSVNFSILPAQPCPAPATLTFTNLTVPASSTYTWNFGDGSPTSTQVNPTHTYTFNGPFEITLIATDANGCKDSLKIVDTIWAKYLDIGPINYNHCVPATIPFVNGLFYPYPIAGATWDFGDGSPTSASLNPIHTYTTAGTF